MAGNDDEKREQLLAELRSLDEKADETWRVLRTSWHGGLKRLLSQASWAAHFDGDEAALVEATYLALRDNGPKEFQRALDAVANASHALASSRTPERLAWLRIALLGLAAHLDD